MTLYTRGYRRYEDGFGARRLRFGPIFVQGYREAIRTKAFRRLMSLFVAILIIHCMMYYFNPEQFLRRVFDSGAKAPSRAETLRGSVASLLGALRWLTPLLVLFVGSGLVAEDLRTRALPLYLVRPITPADYWFGKWLIPAAVLGAALLAPLLILVLFGILLEPSESSLAFAGEQGSARALRSSSPISRASAAYGSLVILLSTLAGRRTPALVLGAASIYGAPMIVGLVVDGAWRRRGGGGSTSGGFLDVVKTLCAPQRRRGGLPRRLRRADRARGGEVHPAGLDRGRDARVPLRADGASS